MLAGPATAVWRSVVGCGLEAHTLMHASCGGLSLFMHPVLYSPKLHGCRAGLSGSAWLPRLPCAYTTQHTCTERPSPFPAFPVPAASCCFLQHVGCSSLARDLPLILKGPQFGVCLLWQLAGLDQAHPHPAHSEQVPRLGAGLGRVLVMQPARHRASHFVRTLVCA